MVRHSICPLCSGNKISKFLKCTDYLVSKEEFDLCKCSACGFVFTWEYPDEKNIGKYYESADYVSHGDRAKGFLNRIYFQVRNVMLRRKKRITEKTIGLRKGKILDIGCGTGYFAGTMKEAGWDVTGIEPNAKARDYGSRRFGINILSPEQLLSLPDKSFDCISMWHVMEHLHDPFKYADEINRLLKPGGFCLAALPNNDSSDAEFYDRFWAAYDLPRHLWHFNPVTFKLFWEKKGFAITNLKRLPIDVFYISILSERNKESKVPILKGLLRGGVFALKSVANKKKCSSLVYVLGRSIDQ
jgi:SAM-dependent methyltransferase